jgi:hypothetical protein
MIIPMLMLAALPETEEYGITVTATLFGMAPGFLLERKYICFSVEGSLGQKSMRFFSGVFILLLLRFVLKAAFSGLEPETLFRFIRYAIIGFWGGFGAPYFFVRTGLQKSRKSNASF